MKKQTLFLLLISLFFVGCDDDNKSSLELNPIPGRILAGVSTADENGILLFMNEIPLETLFFHSQLQCTSSLPTEELPALVKQADEKLTIKGSIQVSRQNSNLITVVFYEDLFLTSAKEEWESLKEGLQLEITSVQTTFHYDVPKGEEDEWIKKIGTYSGATAERIYEGAE